MRLQGFPGAALVAGAGLFLAMTALLAASRAPEDTPSFRLHVAVPDPLLLASGAAFTLAVAIVIGIALSRDRRREEVEREEEPSKLPWWLRAILRALPLLPLLAILVAFSFGWQYVESSLLAWSRFVMFAGSDPGAPQPELPVLSLPWLGWLVGLLLLLAGLATLAVALLLLFAERIARWWERRDGDDAAEPLSEAVQEGLDDLASEPDARLAIIKCYRRFERVAARARVVRAPWQTPDEFMREALRRLVLPRRAVDRLTRLFELARFSAHPLGSAERDTARACLEDIRSELERAEATLGA
ncbi:MAG: hypothetical protein DME01_22585 [Candidatus Rokuibacteriota bacterium]|nr:MAG: hypothetical protein DME01_22585 [Candidatus Rokubacteria bacterium]